VKTCRGRLLNKISTRGEGKWAFILGWMSGGAVLLTIRMKSGFVVFRVACERALLEEGEKNSVWGAKSVEKGG